MTNPNNAIGTNAAYSGRTSPNALNDDIGAFTRGIASGWACSPKSGMTVQLGGVSGTRDVAYAEDNNGNKLTINNRSGAPVEITLAGAPVANNRIDLIVAYVDNPSTGDGSTTDNPGTCGLIAVSGTTAANPTPPNDAAIRSAITADGATGGSAYYAILASILVGTGVTTIGSGVITQGGAAATTAIGDGSITTSKLANSSVTDAKIDKSTIKPYSTTEKVIGATAAGKPIYAITFNVNSPSATDTTTTVATMPANTTPIRIYGTLYNLAVPITIPLPGIISADNWFRLTVNPSTGAIQMGLHQGAYVNNPCEITVEYTKTTD